MITLLERYSMVDTGKAKIYNLVELINKSGLYDTSVNSYIYNTYLYKYVYLLLEGLPAAKNGTKAIFIA